LVLSAIVRVAALVGLCAWGAAAGWWQLWIFLAVVLVLLTVNLVVIARSNRVLFEVRGRFGPFDKPWDRLLVGLMLAFTVTIFVVAGIDVLRYQWSTMPVAWMLAGVLLFVCGDLIVVWCMAKNPFLAPAVRVQYERGHRVVTSGPYRFVRHPMYAGVLVAILGWPLMLGSWWAYVPTVLAAVTFVVRAYLEDATLQRELDGYREYAAETRRRLLPRIW
jgi:protein-S-isoprenylcysteine O-methyltransferase Ste14